MRASSRHGAAFASRASSRRKTTPYRRSNAHAWTSTAASRDASWSPRRSSDHRPAERGAAIADGVGRPADGADDRAQSGEPVRRDQPRGDQLAQRGRRRPRRRGHRRRPRSRRNDAPRARKRRRAPAAPTLNGSGVFSSGADLARLDDVAWSRPSPMCRKRLPDIAVLAKEQRDRASCRPAAPTAAASVGVGTESRAHPTSPVRHSGPASTAGSRSTPRGQNRRVPTPTAASSKPSSAAITDRSPSTPVSRFAGVDVLPREEEAHEIGRADRIDFRPQAVQRVAMDARQQAAGRTIPAVWRRR